MQGNYLGIALENYLKVEIRDRLFFIRSANGSTAFFEPLVSIIGKLGIRIS
tara:strand:+ start:450 stop:602 length:153 start_codon:yes stop_codon:yes gene_type:complete